MEENINEPNLGQELNKKSMSEMSPEEARQKAKDAVGKSVALGAGAIEGYVDNLEPQVVGQAARVTGKTIRNTVDAVKEELPERRSSSSSDFGGIESMSGEQGGGLKERIGERTGAMKERLSERATAVKDAASVKAQELRQRSSEGFTHMKEEMKQHTADEVRAKARDTVGRQVARATGALEGVTEQADPDLPANAVHKTGEVVREASSAIKEEIKGDKSSSSSSSSGSSSGTDASSGGI